MQNLEDENRIKILVESHIDSLVIRWKHKAKMWGGSATSILAILVTLGFTTSDVIDKVRETLLDKEFVSQQLVDAQGTDIFKENFTDFVWETFESSDREKFEQLLKKSVFDEVIIDSYQKEVDSILYGHRTSKKSMRIKTILKLGNYHQNVLVGEYKNPSNALTNCGKIYRQNKRRVVLYIPNSDTSSVPLPWFKCPRGYPQLIVDLTIEDVIVGGILVIGVERPIDSNNIEGVRARVTHRVAEKFLEQGIDLGDHITAGYLRITDVF